MTPDDLLDCVAKHTRARAVRQISRIQSLWGGYGEILRVHLEGATAPSVVVKHVEPPPAPRSGEERRSHERKLRSYAIEEAFYRTHTQGSLAARVPRFVASSRLPNGFLLILEDLDAAGLSVRRGSPRPDELDACLAWLAELHAHFLGHEPDQLWPRGTYWHLATRPDELARTRDPELRSLASELDQALGDARYRTLVHGDAKIQNFCFRERGGDASGRDVSERSASGVAAVDFQYVGGGVGVQDVVYFLDSCLTPRDCAQHLERHLDFYFSALGRALARQGRGEEARAVEDEWRGLVEIAWVDFHRFLIGWAPGSFEGDFGGRLVPRARARLEELLRAPRG